MPTFQMEMNNNSQEEVPTPLDLTVNSSASTTTGINAATSPTKIQPSQLNDLNHVIQSIREVISCCACFNSDFGMKECANGHLLCHTCFLTLRQDDHPQCPTCRAILYPDSRRALTAQKVLSELPDVCLECGQMMLHKDLVGHKLNTCPKRRVTCGLAPLGCTWCGGAEEYHSHYEDCEVRRCLQERPLEESLSNVLARFRRREQMLREMFTCFSAVFRHLEGFELQSVCVPLSLARVTPGRLVFKSDQFHGSQSRWRLKLIVRFDDEGAEEISTPTVSNVGDPIASATSERQEVVETGVETVEQVNSLRDSTENTPSSQNEETNSSHRPRRIFRFTGTQRTRPYPDWRQTRNGSNSSNNPNEGGGSENGCIQSDQSQFGEISFAITKENSPGIGRKNYAFIPLQIESAETGAQVSVRPMISMYRFASRGERTGAFSLYPMRWRYLTNLRELKACRLINMEMVIARKLVDEQAEQV
ncbi:cysteine and histidine rich protein 1 [Echinococcus multilocularis]|uniref:Cysteine and histidine rich protein 1 n=1 Tax=Echinococcus multilocularis TaxID=6211 RepID=A0A087VZQ5_ECHMU|nr:cysteine and histidine rich protein 1 [Echinococcus multilocularis]